MHHGDGKSVRIAIPNLVDILVEGTTMWLTQRMSSSMEPIPNVW